MRRSIILPALGGVMLTVLLLAQAPPKYKDPTVPVDDRVADLLSRMSLPEKVAQLSSYRAREAGAFDCAGCRRSSEGNRRFQLAGPAREPVDPLAGPGH